MGLGARRISAAAVALGAVLAAAGAPAQDVVINEILAANGGVALDEDGDSSDYFELLNLSTAPVNLDGWYATDDPADRREWRFPAVTLPAGGFLVVFASGKSRAVAGAELHASFELNQGGEYLALVRPDGTTIEHQYTPEYPAQRENISYGLAQDVDVLVASGAEVDVLVPASGALGTSWTGADFVPGGSWTAGQTGVGFYAGAGGSTLPPPVGAWSLDGTVEDQSGNDNHGVFVGGAPVYVAGFDGSPASALDLDGAAQYLDVNLSDGLPVYNSPAYTVAMWVRGTPQNDKRVFSEGSSTETNPLFTIGTDNTGATGAVDIFVRTSTTTVVNHLKSQRIAFDGTWHHIAWVDVDGNAALYVDGVLDGTNFDYAKPDLPLNVTSIGAVLRASACCLFDGSIDEAAVWDVALSPADIADLASGLPPVGGNPYSGLIATDIEGAMHGVSATAYARVPFLVDDPAAVESLTLRMKYDDGFVAYVNGVEVARRNAPATPAWSSAATSERDPEEARVNEAINISTHAGALRAEANVLAIHALNSSAADGELLIVPELVASSATGFEARYFRTPTPGAPNTEAFIDFVADTTFSFDRGFYDAPFLVEITTATPGAAIRYTTNQSWPSATTGTVYTGPIPIAGTTTLRAAAFKDGYEPTNVDTHTYVFLDQVIRQPNNPPGYPTSWAGLPADYAMDPEITTDTGSPHYQPTIKDDLKSLPTLSLVVDRPDLFDPTRGIYTNPQSRGVAWERRASVEIIYPDGHEDSFAVNCGVRMQGGSSARTIEAKHSFRLLFKSLYGPSKLRYRLFGDSEVESFDTITLRCFSTDSWHFKDGGSRYRRWDSQFIRDLFMRDSQLAMGHLSSHSTYVHLYLNGMYWGLYNPSERPDDDFNTSYHGDEDADWDVVKDFNELFRGDRTAWNDLMAQARAGLGTAAAYQRIQGNNPNGTRNPAYPVLLDADNLIDYMILHLYGCAEDWPHHNWYAARSRSGNLGGWQWYVWDQEITMDFVFRNRIDVANDNSPALIYSAARANPEFRMRFADLVQRHLFNGGALTNDEARARWMRRATEIDRAVVGESARWGDFREDVPDPTNSPAELYTREDHWVPERDLVLGEHIPESHRLALERFEAGDLYPSVPAPSFSQHGGVVPPGFELEIAAQDGTVYYTLDGGDPRLPGGGVSPTALTGGQGASETLLASGAPCRAEVPVGPGDGLLWTLPVFSEAGWTAGTTGVGYERTTGYEALLGTDLLLEMDGVNASVYIRIPFQVADPEGIESLALRMKFDDGFIAYLNGEEVARANAPASPQWNSIATAANADADAVLFQDFDLSARIGLLQGGPNLLAVHGLNQSDSSSDMLILPEVVASRSAGGGGIPISGPTVVKARALGAEWSALVEAFFYFDIPLRVTELMYHPRDNGPGSDADDFEFVEVMNVGATRLDLAGIRLAGGIEFDFTDGPSALDPGGVLVVVKSLASFVERYPFLDATLTGEYTGRLSNAGDAVRLIGPAGEPIHDFDYSDLWHPETDGEGPSLIIIDPYGVTESWGEAASWRASDEMNGSPGLVEGAVDPTGGWQLVGDVNQDGAIDISDAVRELFIVFLEAPPGPLPCEGGAPDAGANLTIFDFDADGRVELADPLHILNFLFQNGPPPDLGAFCRRVDGCPDVCR
jgi:hypothetical protein